MGAAASNTTSALARLAAVEREIAAVAVELAELEASGEWAAEGAVSFAAWLRHHGRLSQAGAREWQRHGRFLRRFPAFAAAACDGVLSAAQIGLVRNACPPQLDPIMDEQQDALVVILSGLDAGDTQRACGAWHFRATALIDTPTPGGT
jgi:hypothetical protein